MPLLSGLDCLGYLWRYGESEPPTDLPRKREEEIYVKDLKSKIPSLGLGEGQGWVIGDEFEIRVSMGSISSQPTSSLSLRKAH